MPDMLVKLLELPPLGPAMHQMADAGIIIRRVLPHEQSAVRAFVDKEFGVGWGDEISVGYTNKPTTVFIALREGRVVGFGAYECTHRAFFGPTGVSEAERGNGIGGALLLACLWGLREMGYAYAIIGGAGPTGFYTRVSGAVPIPDSSPGIYANPIRKA